MQLEGGAAFSLGTCAQLINCYGQVGRHHVPILGLLNERISCELDKIERMSAQMSRLMQGLVRSHARLNVVPSYLDTLLDRLLDYYNPLNDPAGINNSQSGNPNKAVARLKGCVSLLWSLSVLGLLDYSTYERLEPVLTLAWERQGHFLPSISTAIERVLLDLRFSEAGNVSEKIQSLRPWEYRAEGDSQEPFRNGKANVKAKAPSSNFHLDVSRTLRALGIHHVNEVAVGGGYIEVDGPLHFETYRNEPLGPTTSKRRHLALLGYKVVSLPYWAWDIRNMSVDLKMKYLKGLLTTE